MTSSEPGRGGVEDVNKEFYVKNKYILNEGKNVVTLRQTKWMSTFLAVLGHKECWWNSSDFLEDIITIINQEM